jgi:hypothetical protein
LKKVTESAFTPDWQRSFLIKMQFQIWEIGPSWQSITSILFISQIQAVQKPLRCWKYQKTEQTLFQGQMRRALHGAEFPSAEELLDAML